MKKIIVMIMLVSSLTACSMGANISGGTNGIGTGIGISTGVSF